MTAIDIPDDSQFGTDNLPYGVFSTPGTPPRVGVRIGDTVVDLAAAFGTDGPDAAFAALAAGDVPDIAVHAVGDIVLHLPFEVADYVDFYASEQHAANLGRLFRPDSEPLMPNWKHMPVGYHGRAGTVVVSGTDIIRPSGQRKDPSDTAPTFGPSDRLDMEAELGFIVGVGTRLGAPIPVDAFAEHV